MFEIEKLEKSEPTPGHTQTSAQPRSHIEKIFSTLTEHT
jgi:hypothetical protein